MKFLVVSLKKITFIFFFLLSLCLFSLLLSAFYINAFPDLMSDYEMGFFFVTIEATLPTAGVGVGIFSGFVILLLVLAKIFDFDIGSIDGFCGKEPFDFERAVFRICFFVSISSIVLLAIIALSTITKETDVAFLSLLLAHSSLLGLSGLSASLLTIGILGFGNFSEYMEDFLSRDFDDASDDAPVFSVSSHMFIINATIFTCFITTFQFFPSASFPDVINIAMFVIAVLAVVCFLVKTISALFMSTVGLKELFILIGKGIKALFKGIAFIFKYIGLGIFYGFKYLGIGIWLAIKYSGIGIFYGFKYLGIGIWLAIKYSGIGIFYSFKYLGIGIFYGAKYFGIGMKYAGIGIWIGIKYTGIGIAKASVATAKFFALLGTMTIRAYKLLTKQLIRRPFTQAISDVSDGNIPTPHQATFGEIEQITHVAPIPAVFTAPSRPKQS